MQGCAKARPCISVFCGIIRNFATYNSILMKKTEILKNIKERAGIGQLNEMQRAMAETEKRDILLLAPTGSGKTLAFAIRMLRNVDMPDAPGRGVSAVVIAPSRELVIQIAEVIRPVAAGLKTVAFYGGHAMRDEVNSLSVAPDIIISTPGRLVDHIKRATVDLTNVKSIVLDEYDKSLDLGFYDEMRRIIARIRRPSLRILTSATRFDLAAADPSQRPLFNLDDFSVFNFGGQVVEPACNTVVYEVDSPEKDKLPTLAQLLRSLNNQRVIVFVNHRESAERVYKAMRREGFPVGLYHGGLEQQERRLAVDLLANGSTPILISTDLAARGLDIPEVGSVVHYHIPPQPETWTHRNGRTARQGAEGRVYVILGPDEQIKLDNAEIDDVLADFTPSADPIAASVATLYFNAGKKEKISKGDIAGFLMQKGGLTKDEVGVITLDDHWAIAAVPADKAEEVIARVAPERLKGKRVRITLLQR